MSTPNKRPSSRGVPSSSSRQVSETDRQENENMDTSDLARPLPRSSSPVPPSGKIFKKFRPKNSSNEVNQFDGFFWIFSIFCRKFKSKIVIFIWKIFKKKIFFVKLISEFF